MLTFKTSSCIISKNIFCTFIPPQHSSFQLYSVQCTCLLSVIFIYSYGHSKIHPNILSPFLTSIYSSLRCLTFFNWYILYNVYLFTNHPDILILTSVQVNSYWNPSLRCSTTPSSDYILDPSILTMSYRVSLLQRGGGY